MGNQRIERLWLDLGLQCVRRWKAFFYRLEERHGLDPTQPFHLWLIHTLFLDKLNEDLQEFQEMWNRHGVSTTQMSRKSPLVHCIPLPLSFPKH